MTIGFMQGRLSPIIDGKIQAFPWNFWEDEFLIANKIGLKIMEWTLDYERIYENPIMLADGQKKILKLCKDYEISIESLTADCFMQNPFWKSKGVENNILKSTFIDVINSAISIGIKFIVVPLVDNGSIENDDQENDLISFLKINEKLFSNNNIKILFESDYEPKKLKFFIERFNSKNFGINYDIGNSAANGFSVQEEFLAYGKYILNVHVKDRLLGGSTVPLGEGNADFELVFNYLKNYGYGGNYIMQTARAPDNDHSGVLEFYSKKIRSWIENY